MGAACCSRCFGASGPHDYDVIGNGNDVDRVLRIEILEQESILSDSSNVLRAMPININSTLLASKSPFFHKMFSNGMRESAEKEVTLKIPAYEEVAFMALLDYIKSNTLPKRDELRMLELLMVADKFEVSSCVRSCIELFSSLPKTCEMALLFASLPASIYGSGLMDYVQEYFGKELITLDEFPEDIASVDQAVIEMVLSRGDFFVDTEDAVYDFFMKWVVTHFSDSKERQKFLHSNVRKLICFPNLSAAKLCEFEQCPHVDKEFAMAVKSQARDHNSFTKRTYVLPLVEIKRPDADDDKMCEVLFELKKEELRDLARVRVKNSNAIRVGGQEFYITLHCKSNKIKDDTLHTLGLSLHMRQVPWLTIVDFDVALAVKRRPDVFESTKVRCNKEVFNRRRSGIVNKPFLTNIKLDLLPGDDSKFFIDGTILCKATIRVI